MKIKIIIDSIFFFFFFNVFAHTNFAKQLWPTICRRNATPTVVKTMKNLKMR